METTDWEDCYKAHEQDIDGLIDCISDYIGLCVDNSISTKKVRCYPNNKPRVTSELKTLFNKKKRACESGDKTELKSRQKELKRKLNRNIYRRKLEEKLDKNKIRDGMRKITGFNRKDRGTVEGNTQWANELLTIF